MLAERWTGGRFAGTRMRKNDFTDVERAYRNGGS